MPDFQEVLVLGMGNPLRRDNPPSFMTGGVAGSQVTLCGEWQVVRWLCVESGAWGHSNLDL